MQQLNANQTSNEKVRYYLAPALYRFFARIVDIVVVFLVVFALASLIFMTGSNPIKWTDINSFEGVPSWKYLMISLGSFLIMLSYFICLPCWTRGRTLGCWIFKITVVNMHITRKFWIAIIRREFLLNETFMIISLILGITLCSLGDTNAYQFLKSLLQHSNGNQNFNAGVSVFDALFYISGILFFICILWMFVKNKKRCLQDIMSDTVTIKLNSKSNDSNTSKNEKKSPSVRNYRLPADVESIDLGEVDKF